MTATPRTPVRYAIRAVGLFGLTLTILLLLGLATNFASATPADPAPVEAPPITTSSVVISEGLTDGSTAGVSIGIYVE